MYRAGEVVELINTFSSDWWKGSIPNTQKKGYFPASYAQVGMFVCLSVNVAVHTVTL